MSDIRFFKICFFKYFIDVAEHTPEMQYSTKAEQRAQRRELKQACIDLPSIDLFMRTTQIFASQCCSLI